MRSDEMITVGQRSAFLPPNHPTYPSAVWLQEMNDALKQIFPDLVTVSRQGYWQHSTIFQCTAGRDRYRIPARAVNGGLEKLELNIGDGTFEILENVTENHAQFYESFNGITGTPSYYVHRGDQMELLPSPSSSSMQLRVTYYVRPSRLVTSQSSTQGGDGVVRGQVTAVNTVARTITVNVVPFDQELTVPAAITTANQRIDVIHPNGFYELALVGATQTLSGTTFTVGGTDDLSDIEVGDFVRAAEQTDWPCLPEEFHRTVPDTAAVKVLLQQNLVEKASALATSVGGDIGRLSKLLSQPRTRRAPKRLKAMLRTRGNGAWQRWGQ
jgi:hypothetical protein